MNFFCSDLDNTLIYSYKHDIGMNKVLVEVKDGKELSFMTSNAYNLLKQIANNKILVPVTTRTLKQYLRIDLGKNIPIKYALLANGGILLESGKVNEKWLIDTKKIVKDSEEELKKAYELLSSDLNVFFEVRKADDLFVFTKSYDCDKTIEQLEKHLDKNKVYIEKNGYKVYVFPKRLNKGEAIKRFKDFIGGNHTYLAAGDSKFDIPMLEEADIGICLESLEVVRNTRIKKFSKTVFTEKMLKFVNEY